MDNQIQDILYSDDENEIEILQERDQDNMNHVEQNNIDEVEIPINDTNNTNGMKRNESGLQLSQMPTTVELSQDIYFGGKALDATAKMRKGEKPIVRFNNIHKTYLLGLEGVPALRGVSLSIRKGEYLCIFGTSGGGKTTMLNIMGTIDKPSKGEMILCGQSITSDTPDNVLSALRLRHIGFVFQTFNLLSSLTAIENVEMPMILDGKLSKKERRERAEYLLRRVGMADRLHHVPSQLSGGEQQRVTIARAVANSPEILLLDEPTGDLDTVNTAIVMNLLIELNKKEKITLVMVTHDVGLKFYSDRIIWMRDGKIQRIESVGQKRKQEALQELEADLDKYNVTTESLTKKKEQRKRFHNFMNTKVRKPSDYQTNINYNQNEATALETFATYNAEKKEAQKQAEQLNSIEIE